MVCLSSSDRSDTSITLIIAMKSVWNKIFLQVWWNLEIFFWPHSLHKGIQSTKLITIFQLHIHKFANSWFINSYFLNLTVYFKESIKIGTLLYNPFSLKKTYLQSNHYYVRTYTTTDSSLAVSVVTIFSPSASSITRTSSPPVASSSWMICSFVKKKIEHKSIQASIQNTRLTCIEKAIECIIQQKSKKEIKCYIEIAVNVITDKNQILLRSPWKTDYHAISMDNFHLKY